MCKQFRVATIKEKHVFQGQAIVYQVREIQFHLKASEKSGNHTFETGLAKVMFQKIPADEFISTSDHLLAFIFHDFVLDGQ